MLNSVQQLFTISDDSRGDDGVLVVVMVLLLLLIVFLCNYFPVTWLRYLCDV